MVNAHNRSAVLLGALLVAGTLATPARAADLNEVTTAFEKGNPYDFRLKVSYEATIERTALNREYMGNGTGIDIVKDLIFKQVTHTLEVRAELAIYKDFGFYLALPVILSKQARYGFASGDRYHNYPGETQCRTVEHPDRPWLCNPDGVNANNSRFVQDGLVAGLSGFGYDPTNNSVTVPSAYSVNNGEAGPRSLWDGQSRSGLDQIHLGLHGLIMSQRRHDSYPDWRFGVEFRLSAGKVMDFERDAEGDPQGCDAPSQGNWNCRPALNKAVGKGVHEVRFYTTISKMMKLWEGGGIDTFFHLWYQMPFAYRKSSFYASKYDFSDSFGEESQSPTIKAPMKGGVSFGGEFVVWTDPARNHRVSIELMGMIEGHFEGRDYSQAYELLAGSPTLNLDCAHDYYDHFCANTRLRDRLFYYPGVSTVENFMRLGARIGLHAQITKYVKLSLLYALVHEQEHFLTMDDAGMDNPLGPARDSDGVCRSPVGCFDGVVNIGTTEQNPWHRPAIHQAGHRFRAQETLIHNVTIGLKLMF
ncbi:MAG: hypothetical protein RBU30_23545 [Polyangia bacterium]|jgi:hypothetical protein|nr:hypothetical protein [Polyangia bacterium]